MTKLDMVSAQLPGAPPSRGSRDHRARDLAFLQPVGYTVISFFCKFRDRNMRRSKDTIENPIRDGETSEARLLAAIAAERELMILDSPSGKREYIQTGKNAEALVQLLKSKRMQLIRSKTLTGPYYLGLFDYQGNLRILVCRAKSVPPGDCPYKLNINGKEVVSEYIEKVKIVYGAPAVICVCTTQ